MYTFSTSATIVATSGELSAIFDSKATVTSPPTTGDIIVGDRAGNTDLALVTVLSADTVYLFDRSSGPWTEVFRRESQINAFGFSLDLSGDLILIGVPEFRENLGKIEAWYFDPAVSGQTANTNAQGWNLVTTTTDDNYWGTVSSGIFGTYTALYNDTVYSATGELAGNVFNTQSFNIDFKGNLKLNRACTSNKTKIVETNHFCKVLESTASNKYKMYDQRKDTWLGCIHGSEEFIQAQSTANPEVYSAYSTDILMRGAEGPIDQIVQLDNAGLGFKNEDAARTRYYNFNTGEYEDLPESVVVYEKPTGGYTETWFNNLSAPRAILSGIQFAHMSELPVDEVYFNFDSGTLYMDEFALHNFMDYKYDIDISINEAVSAINDVVHLDNTRTYDRIGTGTGLIWISYETKQNYANSEAITDFPITDERVVNMETSSVRSGGAWEYQYIERIKGVMRSSVGTHKSNVYSIEIKNSNLNEAIEDLEIRALIHRIVERAIREFAVKAAPIHTQLWKVIWSGT